MNHDLQLCTIRGGLDVQQLAAILSVSDRLIAKWLTKIIPVNREHPLHCTISVCTPPIFWSYMELKLKQNWCNWHQWVYITLQPSAHRNRLAHPHTHLTALFPGLQRWAGTRKVKPIWILLKQETVSGSGISWAICKSAPISRQITMPAPHHSVFYRLDALPAAQPTASKHWRQSTKGNNKLALLH